MTDTLITFVRRMIAEDKQAAQNTLWEGSNNKPEWDAPFSATLDYGGDTVLINDATVTSHITRHDPRRALAEADAKKAIVDAYAATLDIRDAAAARIRAAGHKPTSQDLDDWARCGVEAAVMCDLVRALAAVYADKPGYDEAIK